MVDKLCRKRRMFIQKNNRVLGRTECTIKGAVIDLIHENFGLLIDILRCKVKIFTEVKNCLIAFILGIFLMAAGVANFAFGLFLPVLLIIAGVFFIVMSIISMVRFIRNYKKSKVISEQGNQTEIESKIIEPDKKNIKDDLNNDKTKVTPIETHYAEDSLLLLTYIKEKCNCFEPDTLTENEKEQLEKRIDNAVNNIFVNRLTHNSICIEPPSDDGIARYPYGNWIEVKESIKLKDAINLYLELKECVKNKDEIKLDYVEYSRKYFEEKYEEKIHLWDKYEIWRANLTFFIVDKDFDLSDIDDEFAEKLKSNNIHLVTQKNDFEFADIFNSVKYILDYYDEPCGVDWSGTNRYYNLKKLDSQAKSYETKLSENFLCKILLNSIEAERYYRVSTEYFNDVSLNQINIRIQLDKNRLYFLTVYVNASSGIIKGFSFDIEEANDIHYEFDIYSAEVIRKICILNLHDSNYNHKESLNVLLSKYLNEYGVSSLIRLVEKGSFSFHYD